MNIILLISIAFLAGCRTVSSDLPGKESSAEVQSAMQAVASSVSGRELSKEEMEKLNRQISADPQAQSAIRSITESMSGVPTSVKYCPVDGKRFSAHLVNCPDHGVELKEL